MGEISALLSANSLSKAVRLIESDSGPWSRASACIPISGQRLRRAVIIEIQKRVGSLSNTSRESQATDWRCLCAHAERSVVFPHLADAESKVSGREKVVSRAERRRSRTTSVAGKCGGVSLVSTIII